MYFFCGISSIYSAKVTFMVKDYEKFGEFKKVGVRRNDGILDWVGGYQILKSWYPKGIPVKNLISNPGTVLDIREYGN